jgi:nucleoside-diphosphate-sugar epimerase
MSTIVDMELDMKVILAGATGFAGSQVLKHLLADETIEAVTCVTRREIEVQHPKLTTLLHADFTVWPQATAKALSAHCAAIWALGAKATDIADAAEYERVTITTTLSFASAIALYLEHSFRLCYLSGMGADPEEKSWFPWQRTTRIMKGRTERGLQKQMERTPLFHATSFRPGGILPATTGPWSDEILSPIAVRVDRLAKVMIEEVKLMDIPPYRVLSNRSIRRLAK